MATKKDEGFQTTIPGAVLLDPDHECHRLVRNPVQVFFDGAGR